MPAHPLFFPKEIATSFLGLVERGFLTPTFFSALVMAPVLPIQKSVKQDRIPLTASNLRDDLYKRLKKSTPRVSKTGSDELYQEITATHTLHISSENGIERLELIAIEPSDQYVIHYAANGEDAMHLGSMHYRIRKYTNHNHVFWNYPGVGESEGFNWSVYDIYPAGVEQIRYVKNKGTGVSMQNITLMGRSLGGGTALQSAVRFSESAYPNLDIERSFMSISAVPFASLSAELEKSPGYRPFYSALIACAVMGLSFGFVAAGAIATVGLLCATLVAALGYALATCLQYLGMVLEYCLSNDLMIPEFLDNFAMILNNKLISFSWLIQDVFNVIGSMVGLMIAVAGFLIGGLLGAGLGVVLSLQTLIAKEPPVYFPLRYGLKWLTYTALVEMDSVAAMQKILETAEHLPAISSTNTQDDEVIRTKAALNSGLGFDENPSRCSSFSKQVSFFWYKEGGHNEEMGILHDASFALR